MIRCTVFGNTDMICAAVVIIVEFTCNGITMHICILAGTSCIGFSTITGSVGKASAFCLGRNLCLGTLHIDSFESAAIIIIVCTLFNTTIKSGHILPPLLSQELVCPVLTILCNIICVFLPLEAPLLFLLF